MARDGSAREKGKKEEHGVLATDRMLGQVYTIHVNIKTVTAMQIDRREEISGQDRTQYRGHPDKEGLDVEGAQGNREAIGEWKNTEDHETMDISTEEWGMG